METNKTVDASGRRQRKHIRTTKALFAICALSAALMGDPGRAAAAPVSTTVQVPGDALSKLLTPDLTGTIWSDTSHFRDRRIEGRKVTCADGTLGVTIDGQTVDVHLDLPEIRIDGKLKVHRRHHTKTRSVTIWARDIVIDATFGLCPRTALVNVGEVTVGSVGASVNAVVDRIFENRIKDKVRSVATNKIDAFLSDKAPAIVDGLLGSARPACGTPASACSTLAAAINAEASMVEDQLTAAIDIEADFGDDDRSLVAGGITQIVAADDCTVHGSIGIEIASDSQDTTWTGSATLAATASSADAGATICFDQFAVSSAVGSFTAADGDTALTLIGAGLPTDAICVAMGTGSTTTSTSIITTSTTTTSTRPARPTTTTSTNPAQSTTTTSTSPTPSTTSTTEPSSDQLVTLKPLPFFVPPWTGTDDRDFYGGGPLVQTWIRLRVSPDGHSLQAQVTMIAQEAVGGIPSPGRTTARGTFPKRPDDLSPWNASQTWYDVYVAPPGRTLRPQTFADVFHRYVDTDADQQADLNDPTKDSWTGDHFDVDDGFVNSLRYVGDTHGSEAGTYTGVAVTFNPVLVSFQ